MRFTYTFYETMVDGEYPSAKQGEDVRVDMCLSNDNPNAPIDDSAVIYAPAGLTIKQAGITSGVALITLSENSLILDLAPGEGNTLYFYFTLSIPADSSTGTLTAQATCASSTSNYGVTVLEAANPCNPASINLKGLYLDTDATSVGGTRTIYNNGVMCAKFYLGFSYSATDEETTVQNIVDWLADNVSLNVCSDNYDDLGPLTGYEGWSGHGTTDPNGGAYQYDTQVYLAPNNEPYDQTPGDNIWHLAFYASPGKGGGQSEYLPKIQRWLKKHLK